MKKAIRYILLTVCVCVFCYSAYNLINIYLNYKKIDDDYGELAKTYTKEKEEKEEKESYLQINWDELLQRNKDVKAWIQIPNTNVNYPVLQGETNDTYIHSDIDHNELSAGSIFIASENEDPFNDFNTVIYGHNMKNGSMFAQLKKFTQDEETYKKSKYFWIFTPEKNYRYEIISAYTTGVNSDTYTLFKGPGEEFEKYLEKIRGYSEIQTDAEGMNIKDKIITLSTCTGNEATRYVVQGKRVDTLDVGQQNYEEQLPESEENRIAVKADDKNSDDKISVTVFGKNKGGILNGRRS